MKTSDKKSTYVIAEMAWAHDGSLDKALLILEGAKNANADAISIHVTDLNDYMVPKYGSGEGRVSAGKESEAIFNYLNNINLSKEDWIVFSNKAMELEIDLCVMPNDSSSLEFCEDSLFLESYVLSAAAFSEVDFVRAVAAKQKRTFLRIGGASLAEIEDVISIFADQGNDQIVLLYGHQNYPTKVEDTQFNKLNMYKSLFGYPVGMADHLDGDSLEALALPTMAIALGADYIEKHITYDRSEKGEDFEAALGPDSFKTFVGLIRSAEQAMGSTIWSPMSSSEKKYREVSRKKAVAKRNIEAGEKMTRDLVTFKRSDSGLPPGDIDLIIGRVANKPLSENDGLIAENFI